MCGIAGYFHFQEESSPDHELVARMVAMIRHRGPDEFGLYIDRTCALGQARLSIIDLACGSQPLTNEDETVWITYNGEIFNYIELRQVLESHGHSFRTHSDTEVIVHAYEQWGKDCVKQFNGQFAFAIYDKRNQSIFIARDRLGIRPVFYARHGDRLYFASEIKAIFCERGIARQIDPAGLDEIFTWWTTAPPRTAFENIHELEAGCWIEVKNGVLTSGRYWHMTYPEQFDQKRSVESWAEELHSLLVDSVRLRLRADVPVGAYLSGGLDSSVTTALIRNFTDSRLETYSVAFEDEAYDESDYQNQMAAFLGTNHHRITCSYRDIAESFPRVIWHTERPIVRTAPTPLFLLSGLVRQNNFKVVLTGEGSDEIIGGYDIFKETLIRSFWARNPESKWRPMLLSRLYPTLPVSQASTGAYLHSFYKAGLSETDKYYFSHIPRMNTATRIKGFFSEQTKHAIGNYDSVGVFGRNLPERFFDWKHLSRAQYLEAKSLLAGYILSSQGDRVAAANSIECRFPFLDHRLAEFAATVPPWHKIFGLNEKYVLKRAMRKQLPENIRTRVKQPYMAPDSNSFVQPDSPGYVKELLSESALSRAGVFNPAPVVRLYAKCARLANEHLSFKDNMSFVSILSTQLLVHQYIDKFEIPAAIPREKFKTWHDYSHVKTE